MVEAVGVEPTSESTDTRESTCVSALESSPVTLKRRPNRYQLAPIKSRRDASVPPVTTSLLK